MYHSCQMCPCGWSVTQLTIYMCLSSVHLYGCHVFTNAAVVDVLGHVCVCGDMYPVWGGGYVSSVGGYVSCVGVCILCGCPTFRPWLQDGNQGVVQGTVLYLCILLPTHNQEASWEVSSDISCHLVSLSDDRETRLASLRGHVVTLYA